MNKTYGLLMSGEMIRAYKDKLKTETRRTRGLDVVNKSPDQWKFVGFNNSGIATFQEIGIPGDTPTFVHYRAPYGWIGDTLWFKETYAPMCKEADFGYCSCETEEEEKRNHYIEYKADTGNLYPGEWPEEEAKGNPDAPKWRSSMFMKHEYARFQNIPILDVKIERLKDIVGIDAMAEGYRGHPNPDKAGFDAVLWYFELWDRLNGDKLLARVNPWVWVYRFPKYEGNAL